MRLRNIPGAKEEMLVNPYVIQNPEKYSGQFARCIFANDNPVHIEIGMGKGQFLLTLAEAHPKINYIGVEKYSSVLIKAIARQEVKKLPNLRFIRIDAEALSDIFAPGEISRIYLNFSDPWPKDRHAKRRLTSGRFLSSYRRYLKPEGCVEFKTDNESLYRFSLEQAAEAGWETLFVTEDLHSLPEASDNVMTEYEEKFLAEGKPIYKMIIRRKESPDMQTDYPLLTEQLAALAQEEPYYIPLLANASALISEALPDLNWAGFYLLREGRLELGPFQGKTACIHIPLGKGVCGTAAAGDKTILVPNVHEFAGHIACDGASNAEIVIPLHKEGKLFGVLDIDSPVLNRFSPADAEGLEGFARRLEELIRF